MKTVGAEILMNIVRYFRKKRNKERLRETILKDREQVKKEEKSYDITLEPGESRIVCSQTVNNKEKI